MDIEYMITNYLPVCYLLKIQQYPLNTTYNIVKLFGRKKIRYTLSSSLLMY